jgi:hypothetical protein
MVSAAPNATTWAVREDVIKMKRAWMERVCLICKKTFLLRNCYAKRPGAGKYCSPECKHAAYRGAGNPRASKYAAYGSKRSEHLRQLENYQKARIAALERLAEAWHTGLHCIVCKCDQFDLLQVNHINGAVGKQQRAGATLWRKILKTSLDDLLREFNILCAACNWIHFLQKKHKCRYKLEWRGKVEA